MIKKQYDLLHRCNVLKNDDRGQRSFFRLNIYPNLLNRICMAKGIVRCRFYFELSCKIIRITKKNLSNIILSWKAIRSLSTRIGMKTRGWCSNGIARQENLLSVELEALLVAWILSRELNERSNKEIQLSKVPTTRVPCPFSVLLAELIVSGRNLVCIRGFKRRNKLSCKDSLPLLTIQGYLLRFFLFLGRIPLVSLKKIEQRNLWFNLLG